MLSELIPSSSSLTAALRMTCSDLSTLLAWRSCQASLLARFASSSSVLLPVYADVCDALFLGYCLVLQRVICLSLCTPLVLLEQSIVVWLLFLLMGFKLSFFSDQLVLKNLGVLPVKVFQHLLLLHLKLLSAVKLLLRVSISSRIGS